jgi:hypothetical protein
VVELELDAVVGWYAVEWQWQVMERWCGMCSRQIRGFCCVWGCENVEVGRMLALRSVQWMEYMPFLEEPMEIAASCLVLGFVAAVVVMENDDIF